MRDLRMAHLDSRGFDPSGFSVLRDAMPGSRGESPRKLGSEILTCIFLVCKPAVRCSYLPREGSAVSAT